MSSLSLRILLGAALEEPIPPLHPPRGPMLPTAWEKNELFVVLGVIILAAAVIFLIWWRKTARHKVGSIDALSIARAKLTQLNESSAEPATSPDLVSQIIRWALLEHFQLPWMEYTTEEFTSLIEANHWLPPELTNELHTLLAACDRARFAVKRAEQGLPARARAFLERVAEADKTRNATPAQGAGDKPAHPVPAA